MERMREEGVEPNTHIYNSAITACARCDMTDKALELFEDMGKRGLKQDVVTYNAILDATCARQDVARKLFQEGISKGYYSKLSRLGKEWLELDLHFLSLGAGEVALGWWLEEGILPILREGDALVEVKSIGIVTGYGRTRLRGERDRGDGMRKRVQAQLQFMHIEEEERPNKGRVHILPKSLVELAEANNGRLTFDSSGYQRFKAEHTTAHSKPSAEQVRRPRNGAPRKEETFIILPDEDTRTEEEREFRGGGGRGGRGQGRGGRGRGRGGRFSGRGYDRPSSYSSYDSDRPQHHHGGAGRGGVGGGRGGRGHYDSGNSYDRRDSGGRGFSRSDSYGNQQSSNQRGSDDYSNERRDFNNNHYGSGTRDQQQWNNRQSSNDRHNQPYSRQY